MSHIKILLGCFLLLLLTVDVVAKNEMDSLQSLLISATGQQRVDVLNQISSRLGNINPDEALAYSQMAHGEAVKLDYDEGTIIALKIIGNIYALKSNLDTAFVILHHGMKMAEEANSIREKVSIGGALGAVYMRTYQYEKALEILLESLLSARSIDWKNGEMAVLMNLAIARKNTNDLEGAESSLVEALAIGLDNGNQLRTAQVYGNLGNLEFDRGNYQIARDYQQNGIEIFRELGASQMVAISFIQLGRIDTELRKYESALTHFDSALTIREPTGTDRGIISIYRYKAQTLLNLRKLDESSDLVMKALPIAERIKDYAILKDLYETGFHLAEFSKNWREALEYHKLMTAVRDSLEARAGRDRVKQLTAKFDFERMEVMANAEFQKSEIKQLRIEQRNLFIFVLMALLLALLVIFGLNRSRLRNRLLLAKKDRLILEKEAQLHVSKLQEQGRELEEYKDEFTRLKEVRSSESETEDLIDLLSHTPLQAKDWAMFKVKFEKAYPDFYDRFEEASFTVNEQRLITLLKLGLATKEIAQILAITPNSIIKAKSRLSVKLNLSTQEMDRFIERL